MMIALKKCDLLSVNKFFLWSGLDVIEANILSKFHQDGVKAVNSTVLTNYLLTTDYCNDRWQTKGDHNSSPWAFAQVN